MSDTPRTDMNSWHNGTVEVVLADFAGDLERELNTALKELQEAKERIAMFEATIARHFEPCK